MKQPRLASSLFAFMIFVMSGCGASGEEDPGPRTQPSDWNSEIRGTEAVDLNPDPNVVEVELRAQVANIEFTPGVFTPAWTYNGTVPGPLIRAKKGDRVIVHFTNELPEATTIHWHGLRIPAEMDGMPGHSQPPVEPGGTFTYDFVVPDASTFWYHPHFHSAAQVGDGLYAPFVVDDPEEPTGFGDELVLVLSDLATYPDGSLQPADASGDLATLFGREGNLLLVNGKVRPTLRARAGVAQRWRVINAAKSRYFQLAAPDQSFTRIGGDGGLLPEPSEVAEPVVIPGERADLVFVPNGKAGERVVVYWKAYDRGYGSTFNRPPEPLFEISFEGERLPALQVPATNRSITAINTDAATPVELRLTQAQGTPRLELGINDVPFDRSEPLVASVGERQIWTVTNTMAWAHPFHLHGFFFQVLDRPGPLEWKDTVDVPVDATVRLAVEYDDRPGHWMFHCHILDHADAGMMGTLLLGAHAH